MLKHLPNFLTCCNLLSGCIGVVFLLEGHHTPGAYFVWAAALFDFFDGFIARLLRVSSPIGKELDSLADMVSFGLLPAIAMYLMLQPVASGPLIPFAAFLIALCSALRLAIFNVDETQKDSFRGVPTPANALFITSLPLLNAGAVGWLHQQWVLLAITGVFSLLLVSRVELFALKFKSFSWAGNEVRFTFLGLSVLLVAWLQFSALPLIILLYIALSLGARVISKSES